MATAATVTASFAFDVWEEEPIVDGGHLRVHRTRFKKRWEGEIEGRSGGEMLMVHVAGQPAAYCGFELVTAALTGRAGTFLFTTTSARGLTMV